MGSKVTMNGSIVYVLLLLGIVMAVIAQDITEPVVITLPPGNITRETSLFINQTKS